MSLDSVMITLKQQCGRARMPRRLPVLDDSTQAGVNSLATASTTVVSSLGEYAVEYLKATKPPEGKALHTAAGRLGFTDADSFETALLSVCNLYWEAAKARLQDQELSRAMVQFTLSDELKQALVQVYAGSQKDLRRLIGKLTGSLPHYHDLDWRLDVELGRRSRLHEPRPMYLLRLDTTSPDGEEGQSYHLQADYASLKKVLTSLDAAIADVSSAHCQRFARYIK